MKDPVKLTDYYNRYDQDKGYDKILFRSSRTSQSAEQNELQDIINGKMRNALDALFKDGDIIRDAIISYNEKTGQARCGAGLIYLAGAVRAVGEGEFIVPPAGLVSIGVFLTAQVITELEDPELYNPAIGTRSEGEPGAARLRLAAQWGLSITAAGSAAGDEFYPVYTVDNGSLQAKEPPPNLDSLTQALARYDRDSAGGTYVVTGLVARIAEDSEAGHQVYTISEGRARVFGYPVELTTSRRIVYPAQPELLEIESEVHAATGEEFQKLTLGRYPVGRVTRVRLTRQTTETITHGGFTGALDPLPHTSVTRIISVVQGGITFAPETDFRLNASRVDWSPSGSEPAPHSTYSVTYQYMATENSPACDLEGITVEGAVPDTHIFVDYFQMLSRLDCLCINRDGAFLFVPGIPSEWTPQRPTVADDLLTIATIYQTWSPERRLVNDGVRVVPMDEIASINTRLDALTEHMAQQRLTSDLFTREAGAKKGLFVDPFLSDQMRDQGLPQTGAIFDGCLTLPVAVAQVLAMANDLNIPARLEYVADVALEQLLRTGEMKVNPYDAFDPLPAPATLTPAIDRWTETQTNWESAVTQQINTGSGAVARTSQSTATQTLSSVTNNIEFLRQIDVAFRIDGLGPNERVEITFDGLSVAPVNNTANAAGALASSFRIPAKVPAGSKSVVFTGSGGSQGQAVFVGQGQLTVQVLRNVTTVVRAWYDPLAQTFALAEACQICGVDLWFTKKHTSRVVVQIRETTVGIPNQNVLGEAIVAPANIAVNGTPTRVIFNVPVMTTVDTEYAIVIMCDDSVTSVAVAELGKWDTTYGRWVTAQPYQIGVLLSSSNASTWTPHQSLDLTFRLLKAVYSEVSAEVDLGQVEIEAATDLMMLAIAEQPSAQARVECRLTLPDKSVISVPDGQGVRLPEPLTGLVGIKARMSGSAAVSPIVYPGAQLVCGSVGLSADYITRAMPAGPGSRVKVILDAHLPAGSGVKAEMAADGEGVWLDMDFQNSRPLDEGWHELVFEGLTDALLVRVRLTLSGTSAARPRVADLRVLTI